MLKLILKTIMISVISSVLMVNDLVVFADTQGKATKGSDGVYSKTNTYDFGAVSSSTDSAGNIIMMIMLAFIATKMISYKKWSYDMMAAAAAGGIYLVGEVLNIATAKKDMEKISASLTLRSDGAVDSTQVEYIRSLKTSYQKVIEALKRKQMLLKAALAGFLIATGIAAYQKGMIWYSSSMCTAAYTSAKAKLATALGACSKLATGAGACALQVEACQGKLLSDQPIFTKLWAEFDVPMMSFAKFTKESVPLTAYTSALAIKCAAPLSPEAMAVDEYVTTTCTKFVTDYTTYSAYGVFTPTASINQNDIFTKFLKITEQKQMETKKTFLQSFVSLFVENAHAGWLSLLGLAGGWALAQIKVLGDYVDTMMYSPGLRIAAWGTLTGICAWAISDTGKKIDDAQSNIDKIDKILNETDRLSKGVQNSNATVTTVPTLANTFGTNDVTLSTTDKTGCLAGSTSSSCTSLSSLAASTNLGISDLPSGLSTSASQLTSTADSLSGTGKLSTAALSSIASLGNQANAIKKLNNSLFKKLQQLNNSKEDFSGKANAQKFANNAGSLSNSALKKSGQTTSGALASIGLGNSYSSGAISEANPKLEETKLPTTKATAVAEKTPSGQINKAFDLKLDDQAAVPETLANGMKEGSASDKYEIKENDINPDSKTSIFEVISIRYLKSGYPKLLEEETVK